MIDEPLALLESFDIPRPAEPQERLLVAEPIPGVVFSWIDGGIDLGAQLGEEDVLGDVMEVRPPDATNAKGERVLIVDCQ